MDEKHRKDIPPHDPRALPDQPEEQVTERTVPASGKPGAAPEPPRPRDR